MIGEVLQLWKYSANIDVGGLPAPLQSGFGLRTVLRVPVPALAALLLAVLLWGVLRFSRYGLRTLAIGSLRLARWR